MFRQSGAYRTTYQRATKPPRQRAGNCKQCNGKRIPGRDEERRIVGAVRSIERRGETSGNKARDGSGRARVLSARHA